ncbi:MAG: class I SAM-dependent methyltransferase [Neobacillus sp.]
MIKIRRQIEMTDALNDYITKYSLRESEVLAELRRVTELDSHHLMQITPIQGQLLAFLAKAIGAKKTIDIGTYTGYSALCVALALPNDSKTIACDINAYWGNIAEAFWKKAQVSHKISLQLQDAANTLNKLINNGEPETFDFILIDADKVNYDKYFEQSMILIRKGGIIVIDNTLLYGSVLITNIAQDDLRDTISLTVQDVYAIQKLNAKLAVDDRIDQSLLPVGDGLTIIRKK